MPKIRLNDNDVQHDYLSIAQITARLVDTTFLWCELGRGSGKTTHILGPRIDRVQNSMPGACLVLAGATYTSILDNILPALMEYFNTNYRRGVYFEVGRKPPKHFAPCVSFVEKWNHTISFHNGCVIQFVSCDRPESMLGKNAAHLFIDELVKIPQDKFVSNIMPALRADRSRFGSSHFFGGITGTSSTPNIETDFDWWTKNEANQNKELINCIIESALYADGVIARKIAALDKGRYKIANGLQAQYDRVIKQINEGRRGATFYLRASSLSNIKILGLDYIENMLENMPAADVYTSIFAVRQTGVKNMFFGKFDKQQHIFYDSYKYTGVIDNATAGEFTHDSRALAHCNSDLPLYMGYDPGPFSSIVVGQYANDGTFRVIKNFWAIHPKQHKEIAADIAAFFANHNNKKVFLHYDRAANQVNPNWRKYYPIDGGIKDADAQLFKQAMAANGFNVQLMSLNQKTILHAQHYRLLNVILPAPEKYSNRPAIVIDGNECEALISSIYHSPIKQTTEGGVELDKSSEKKLDYTDQAFYSTQIATAFLYLLWGEFSRYAPAGDTGQSGSYYF